MRDRIINVSFSIGLLFIGGLFSHFFWVKETGSQRINNEIEVLKKEKLDKVEFIKHVDDQKKERQDDKQELKEYMGVQFQDIKELIKAMHDKNK